MGAELGQQMTHVAIDHITDELISTCMARQVANGEDRAQGITTPLAMAGCLVPLLLLTQLPPADVLATHSVKRGRQSRSCLRKMALSGNSVRRIAAESTCWACLTRESSIIQHSRMPSDHCDQ